MRDAFFRALADLGAADERVWALTGDLGVGLFEPFEAVAPGRYLNVGIAEQTLVGVAAGLAYAGKVPFAYSIAPFVTSRAHDQVRVDVACAAANVKLVGVGSGVSYGTLGPTHHAIDDIALTRVLPEAIDRVEERRERLPGAGRRLDQHVLAARDRRPAELLRRCRRIECPLEPGARCR